MKLKKNVQEKSALADCDPTGIFAKQWMVIQGKC